MAILCIEILLYVRLRNSKNKKKNEKHFPLFVLQYTKCNGNQKRTFEIEIISNAMPKTVQVEQVHRSYVIWNVKIIIVFSTAVDKTSWGYN